MVCIKRSNLVAVLFSLGLTSAAVAAEQTAGSWRIDAPETLDRGEIAELNVVFTLNDSWRLYAPTRSNEAQGVTIVSVSFDSPSGIAVSKPQFPRAVDDGQFQVLDGETVVIRHKIRARSSVRPGDYSLSGVITYQFCKPNLCLPPRRDSVDVPVIVI